MKRIFIHTIYSLAAVALATAVSACHDVIDDRIPVMPVQITFNTVADWNLYGVGGALESRRFIRDERVPANFPYTAMTYTGFGGVLLTCDVMGNPQAFDLSCPVERRQAIRVSVNQKEHLAECPKCGSTYDVFTLPGTPLSGPAAKDGYGLRRYSVRSGQGSAYMVISN